MRCFVVAASSRVIEITARECGGELSRVVTRRFQVARAKRARLVVCAARPRPDPHGSGGRDPRSEGPRVRRLRIRMRDPNGREATILRDKRQDPELSGSSRRSVSHVHADEIFLERNTPSSRDAQLPRAPTMERRDKDSVVSEQAVELDEPSAQFSARWLKTESA